MCEFCYIFHKQILPSLNKTKTNTGVLSSYCREIRSLSNGCIRNSRGSLGHLPQQLYSTPGILPHGFSGHALSDFIGRQEQLHSSGGTGHHGRGKRV